MNLNQSAQTTALGIAVLISVAALDSTLLAQPIRSVQQQDRPPIQTSPVEQGTTSMFPNSGKDYLISPRDVIEIRVEDAPELSHQYQVTASGDIEMPVLGRVSVKQKTTYELGRLIAAGLREQEYLKSPNVVVSILQYNSQAFFIQGAVGKPGLYQLKGRPSLLTLIGLAGGLTEHHGSTIFILRPTNAPRRAAGNQNSNSQDQTRAQVQTQTPAPDSTSESEADDSESKTAADYQLIKVNLPALYKGDFDRNQKLEPGDIVNIPRADVFFIAGEVRAPGSFTLKDGTTLRQAISLAQGMTFKAKPSRGIIFREAPVPGSKLEINVDISAVMSGKKEDVPIQANDVIIVPNSKAKSIGGTILMSVGFNSVRVPLPY